MPVPDLLWRGGGKGSKDSGGGRGRKENQTNRGEGEKRNSIAVDGSWGAEGAYWGCWKKRTNACSNYKGALL